MSYIYSPAKHRRSGSAMQKMPRRGLHKRMLAAREVLPGYPWSGQFSTRQEVDKYLSGDEITCLICGKPYKMLAPHTKRIHGVSIADYKSRFGIPQYRGINGEDNSRRHRENAAARGLGEIVKPVLERHRFKPPKKARPHVPFVKWEMTTRVNAVSPGGELRNVRDQRLYRDFSWHLEMCALHFAYREIAPPVGHASWRAFKRWLTRDPALRASFKDARKHRMQQRGAVSP